MRKRPMKLHNCRIAGILLAIVITVGAETGCIGGSTARAYPIPTGGDAKRGEQVILSKNCGSCHTIPGIRSAAGLVGPPLLFFGRRTYIAGQIPNSPENLERWLRSPQSVERDTAMPNLGLTAEQARDVAAYIENLR